MNTPPSAATHAPAARQLRTLAIVSTGVAAVALGSAAFLGNEIREIRSANSHTINYFEDRVDDVEDELARTRSDLEATDTRVLAVDGKVGDVGTAQTVNRQLVLLRGDVDQLLASGGRAATGSSAYLYLDELSWQLDDLRSCVNAFMEDAEGAEGASFSSTSC